MRWFGCASNARVCARASELCLRRHGQCWLLERAVPTSSRSVLTTRASCACVVTVLKGMSASPYTALLTSTRLCSVRPPTTWHQTVHGRTRQGQGQGQEHCEVSNHCTFQQSLTRSRPRWTRVRNRPRWNWQYPWRHLQRHAHPPSTRSPTHR